MSMYAKKNQCGFTLIELMMVIAVIAILAAIALPSYQSSIIRGKRAAAQAQMLDIANREQLYLVANSIYATKDQLQTNGYSLPSEVSAVYTYEIALGVGALPTYTITFTPIPTSSQASDGAISLTSEGVKTPPDKWK